MIKFFEKGNKEQIKRVLEEVYNCQNVEQLSDDELVFCFIAKTLKSLENFCELAESVEADLGYTVKKLENRIKRLEKRLKKDKKMNSAQIMAFNEISQWIKYKGFTQEHLAQILHAVDKECLKARGVTISELISKGAKNE